MLPQGTILRCNKSHLEQKKLKTMFQFADNSGTTTTTPLTGKT